MSNWLKFQDEDEDDEDEIIEPLMPNCSESTYRIFDGTKTISMQEVSYEDIDSSILENMYNLIKKIKNPQIECGEDGGGGTDWIEDAFNLAKKVKDKKLTLEEAKKKYDVLIEKGW